MTHQLPAYVRLPRSGRREHFSGLSRTALYELTTGHRPPVESVVIRKRGAVRGVRLVNLQSLLDYLRSQAAIDATEPGHGEEAR